MIFPLLVPSGVPTSVTSKTNGTKSCVLAWQPVRSDPDPDASIIGYDINYVIVNTSKESNIAVFGPNTTSYVVSDLEEFSLYSMRVAAFNSGGTGNYSDATMCSTEQDGTIKTF